MISTKIAVEFGHATLGVGARQLDDGTFRVAIYENIKPAEVGETIANEDCLTGQIISLIFPTELQMLNVMAAFVNRGYDEVKTRYDAAVAKKKEAEETDLQWVAQIKSDGSEARG
jgi:hypothetical protein